MNKKELDKSTEERIKESARKVFHAKGFAATRTRDIAEEANINLALLNYYFRSKQKLFELIIMETLSGFFLSVSQVLNDPGSSIEQKIETLVSKYIDLLSNEPEIPTFVIGELRSNPQLLLDRLPSRTLIFESVFLQQFQEAIIQGKIEPINPVHFIMNMVSMIIFPFMTKPVLKHVVGANDAEFNALMQERKKLIPIWIKRMLVKK
ncbi:MAG: TetR family transcriptional regulator [Ferruginibacter sp.]